MSAPRNRWRGLAIEGALAFAVAGLFVATAAWIEVEPLDRLGQVSALAALGLRFTLAALVLVAALLAARRLGGESFALVLACTCAASAGLASGMVAGGVRVALQGTPWCLNGELGDAGVLAGFADWARGLRYGQPAYPYPPLTVLTLAGYGELLELPSPFALKHLQILGTACFGPVAYLSWRLLLPPLWALGIGVLAALPLIEPYKPYGNLVLIVFVPLTILTLQHLRRAPERPLRVLLATGAGFGAAFALLCLGYAGWFRWSAPGLVVAGLVCLPWRAGRWRALAFLGASAAVFLLLCGGYVRRALAAGLVDPHVSVGALVEPAYFAMWRWDPPQTLADWPLPGELGGVGLFTLLLALGWGLALAHGRERTAVATLSLLIASALLMRFGLAQQMFASRQVQLFPRTSIQLLHCALLLCGYAALGLVHAAREAGRLRGWSDDHRAALGLLCGLLLVLGSAGSSIADRHMPREASGGLAPSRGELAWRAHELRDTSVEQVAHERRQRILERLRASFGPEPFDLFQATAALVPPEREGPTSLTTEKARERIGQALEDLEECVLEGLCLVPVTSALDGDARWRVQRR